ncbi:hypothetical protein [Amycolatopsis nigrescens]|uniref:hypothetical protein n=1 Tax=Amycolatopsis nigrescens TaxID=381445 RepID=UPI00037F70A5|nr:hypothetical protein [Amycolatopsis nigrescens]
METARERLLVEGSRDELIAELRRLEIGWRHLAKDNKAAEALQGVHDLLTGSTSVRVGHTFYDVTGG